MNNLEYEIGVSNSGLLSHQVSLYLSLYVSYNLFQQRAIQRVSTLTNALPKLKFFGLDCSNLAALFINPPKKPPNHPPDKISGLDLMDLGLPASHAPFSVTGLADTSLIDFNILQVTISHYPNDPQTPYSGHQEEIHTSDSLPSSPHSIRQAAQL